MVTGECVRMSVSKDCYLQVEHLGIEPELYESQVQHHSNRSHIFILFTEKECCVWLILQLFDTYSLDHMKTYKTERPVNSAAISPLKPHV